jgi:hypothetical protein
MTVLLDVCHPSTEIKLLDVVDAVHLASNTLPQGEVCTRASMATLNFMIITSSKLLTVLYISPERCDLVNDVTHITVRISVVVMKNQRRSASVPLLLPPQY